MTYSTFQESKWYPYMIMKKDVQKRSRLQRYGHLNMSFFFFFFFFLGVCVCVLICSTLQYMFESTHMHTQAMGAWKVFVQHAVEVQLPVYSFKLVSPPPLPPPRRAGCRDSVKFGAITMARLAQLMRLCL